MTLVGLVIINILLFIIACFMYLVSKITVYYVYIPATREHVTYIEGNLDKVTNDLEWLEGEYRITNTKTLLDIMKDYLNN